GRCHFLPVRERKSLLVDRPTHITASARAKNTTPAPILVRIEMRLTRQGSGLCGARASPEDAALDVFSSDPAEKQSARPPPRCSAEAGRALRLTRPVQPLLHSATNRTGLTEFEGAGAPRTGAGTGGVV